MKPFSIQKVLVATLGLLAWVGTVLLAVTLPDYDKAIVFVGVVVDVLLAMYYIRL